jgi:hypothetical protein
MKPRLVSTPSTEGALHTIAYARNKDGRIDLDAYKGLTGTIESNNLKIDVKINNARVRYGHLDLNVSPMSGAGEVWVERKNIEINNDPAAKAPVAKMKTRKIDESKPENAFPKNDIKEMIRMMIQEERQKAV